MTNGSKTTIDVSSTTALVTYGPDGEEAKYVYDGGVDDMSGKVLPKGQDGHLRRRRAEEVPR